MLGKQEIGLKQNMCKRMHKSKCYNILTMVLTNLVYMVSGASFSKSKERRNSRLPMPALTNVAQMNFDSQVYYFEQNRMVRTLQNFELFDKQLLTILTNG